MWDNLGDMRPSPSSSLRRGNATVPSVAEQLTPGQRLVEAVCSRDPEAAAVAMRDHLFSVIDALRKLAGLGPSPLLPSTAWG
jgi:DNA-binding FadR family transcriptional regulator